MKNIFVLVLLVFSILSLSAEELSKVTVIYAEGSGFTVYRENNSEIIDVFAEDGFGFELFEGDMINIDQDTYIEIQIRPSNNILHISENTNFKITMLEQKGGGIFTLTFGRIRANVAKLAGKEQFKITGPSAVAGVRGTNYGYDILASANGSITQIYCFEGTVEVSQIPKKGEEVQILELNSDEMISVSSKEPERSLTKEIISASIKEYWNTHPAKGTLIETESGKDKPDLIIETEESSEEIIIDTEKETEPAASRFSLDAGGGLTFTALSAAKKEELEASTGENLAFLAQFITILASLRAGPVIDAVYNFSDSIGLGLETGLLYITYGEGESETHAFDIPIFLIPRFTFGPVCLQPYLGARVTGFISEAAFSTGIVYDIGIKPGIRLGSILIYGNTGLVFSDMNSITSFDYLLKFGIGAVYNLLE